jgi:hypothetical protein
MSESPIIQALQSIYDGAKTIALAELAQYGKGWNVVGVHQTSLTEYLAVARGPLPPPDFIQKEIRASCTVTCIDSLMGKADVGMELTYDGKWKVTDIRKYTGR